MSVDDENTNVKTARVPICLRMGAFYSTSKLWLRPKYTVPAPASWRYAHRGMKRDVSFYLLPTLQKNNKQKVSPK